MFWQDFASSLVHLIGSTIRPIMRPLRTVVNKISVYEFVISRKDTTDNRKTIFTTNCHQNLFRTCFRSCWLINYYREEVYDILFDFSQIFTLGPNSQKLDIFSGTNVNKQQYIVNITSLRHFCFEFYQSESELLHR